MSTTTRITFALLLGALLLGGCRRDDANGASDASTDATSDTAAADTAAADAANDPMTTPPGDPMAATPADGPALVAAIDQHEIDAAQLALTKATRADVKEYATMLDTEHRANLAQAQALPGGTGQDSPAVAAHRQKGQAELERLRAVDAAAFDTAYLDAMVAGHTEALTTIDTQLLPGAQDPAVVEFLTRTREAVAKHLDQARALQGGTGAAAGTNPGGMAH